MSDFLSNVVWPVLTSSMEFFLKAGIVAFLFVAVFLIFFQMTKEQKHKKKMEVEDLEQSLENYYLQVKKSILGKKPYDKLLKIVNKKRKDRESKHVYGPVVFVIDFEGDIHASRVEFFREEVSAVLESADPKKDEVVVRIESRGGSVHSYGLAASQLKRIRDKKISLTVCVDKVAASGGYMMACVGDKIVSAPFAIIGSIGVFAGVPNIHRLLKKHDVDYEEITAGEFKRTISLFGEISPKGRQKFLEQIEDVHKLFKNFVVDNRPSLALSKVATGEYWYGLRAKELNLVDEISSSDDYINQALKEGKKVFKIKLNVKKSLADRIGDKFGEISFFKKLKKRYNVKQPDILPDSFPDSFPGSFPHHFF